MTAFSGCCLFSAAHFVLTLQTLSRLSPFLTLHAHISAFLASYHSVSSCLVLSLESNTFITLCFSPMSYLKTAEGHLIFPNSNVTFLVFSSYLPQSITTHLLVWCTSHFMHPNLHTLQIWFEGLKFFSNHKPLYSVFKRFLRKKCIPLISRKFLSIPLYTNCYKDKLFLSNGF